MILEILFYIYGLPFLYWLLIGPIVANYVDRYFYKDGKSEITDTDVQFCHVVAWIPLANIFGMAVSLFMLVITFLFQLSWFIITTFNKVGR